MIITVSARQEPEKADDPNTESITYSLALGPIYGKMEGTNYQLVTEHDCATIEEFQRAVTAAMHQVGIEALSRKWIK